MVRLQISVKDDLQVVRAVEQRLHDLRPVLRLLGTMARTAIVRNFEVGGRPTRWKISKRVEKSGGQTLVKSARLKDSIAGAQPQVDDTSVMLGTTVAYAAIHNFGGVIKRRARSQTLAFGKGGFISRKFAGRRKTGATKIAIAEIGAHEIHMPRREFMVLQDADLINMKNEIVRYLTGR